jgi:hypothetical protein
MSAPEESGLAAKVQAVLDRMTIEELFVRYYSGMGSGEGGSGEGEGLGGFFADAFHLDVNGLIATSKDELIQLSRDVMADKPRLTGTFRMILSNMVIELDGDTARARMMWTQTLNDTLKGPPRFIEQGLEYDLLVRQNGRWKIKKRVVIADSGMPDIMDACYRPRPDFTLADL